MADARERFDLEALRALVEQDAGCPEFPALAEAERRAGHPDRARDVAEAGLHAAPARLAGRVALGLALLDRGDLDLAKEELASVLETVLEPHRLADEPAPNEEPAVEAALEAAVEPDAEPEPTPAEPEALPTTPNPEDSARELLALGAVPLDDAAAATDAPPMAAEAPAPPADVELLHQAMEAVGADEAEDDLAAAVALEDGAADLSAGVGDAELDQAFAEAEPQVDEMISPNRMVEQTLLDHAPVDEDEEHAEEEEPPLAVEASPAFRTATMAELLERQGDGERAEAIRRELEPEEVPEREAEVSVDAAVAPESDANFISATPILDDPGPPPAAAPAAGEGEVVRSRILATLETWLHNIQRGRA